MAKVSAGYSRKQNAGKLFEAAQLGDLEACKFLIYTAGENVNDVDEEGKSVLYHAALSNSVNARQVVSLLLDNNVDYNKDLAKLLVETDPNPNSSESVFYLLVNRCINVGNEAKTGQVIRSIILHYDALNQIELTRVLRAGGFLRNIIPYSNEQEVRILHYFGCLRILLPEHDEVAYIKWHEAVTLMKQHGIQDLPNLLPYANEKEFEKDILQRPQDSHVLISRLFGIYFYLMAAMKNSRLIYLGIKYLHQYSILNREVSTFAEHKFYIYMAKCLLYNFEPASPAEFNLYVTVIICIFYCSGKSLTNAEEHEISKKLIIDFVWRRTMDNQTTLHLAAFVDDSSTRIGVIKFLLQFGLDVHARNGDDETPLQVYVNQNSEDPQLMSTVNLFIQYGTHVDERLTRTRRLHEHLNACGGIGAFNEGEHLNLRCLAARCIADYSIPYEGEIPQMLYKFVEIHR